MPQEVRPGSAPFFALVIQFGYTPNANDFQVDRVTQYTRSCGRDGRCSRLSVTDTNITIANERNDNVAKMKAVQVPKAGADFEIVEREIPQPGPGQVRIRVEACGVCHSDVLTKEGILPGISYPRVTERWWRTNELHFSRQVHAQRKKMRTLFSR